MNEYWLEIKGLCKYVMFWPLKNLGECLGLWNKPVENLPQELFYHFLGTSSTVVKMSLLRETNFHEGRE